MIRVYISTKSRKYIKTFASYEEAAQYIQSNPEVIGAEIVG